MNTKKILLYAVLSLFSLFTLLAGIPKLLALDMVLEGLGFLGLSTLLLRFIGLCWVLAGIGVWKPEFRSLAALATFPIIFGAIGMHVITDGMWYGLLPILVLASAVLYMDGFFGRIRNR